MNSARRGIYQPSRYAAFFMSGENMKASLTVIVLFIAGLIGWILNIVKIVGSGFVLAEWGGMQVARVIGVFVAPLGAVLGWF